MRIFLLISLAILLFSARLQAQAGRKGRWQTLFNGKNLVGWETYLDRPYGSSRGASSLGLNNDPNRVFSVVKVDGQPALRISGETFGGINTLDDFENYHLRLEFKWGEKQWPPKLGQPRDSGLLYHSVGAHGTPMLWMESFEYQIQEGDCGDYWGVMDVAADIPARKNTQGKYIYQAGAETVSFQDKTSNGRSCLKSPNTEKASGEWNRLDLYCLGDTCLHVLNGTLNMVLTKTRHLVNGKMEPLTRGKIQLQSEGAEIYYRNIQLRSINQLPGRAVALRFSYKGRENGRLSFKTNFMYKRTIGQSNLDVSVITFGAWAAGGWMWGGTERSEAVEAIRASYDVGVTAIDTAPIYGQGLSEEIVGEAIRDLPRDKVQLLTKFGLRWDLTRGDFHMHSHDNDGNPIEVYKYAGRDSIIKECEDSLKRLGTDYIDLYQIHWPDKTTPIAESMEAVGRLIEQGKVRYAGVCNYSAEQLDEALQAVDLVSNQVPYSMVKRGIETETVPYCLNHNLSILAYSPMERGLLTGKIKSGHSFAPDDHRAKLPLFTDQNLERVTDFLAKIAPLAGDKGVTLGQLVLKWTIEQPGITVALAGARNKQQAVENAAAADLSLTADELTLITNEVDKLAL